MFEKIRSRWNQLGPTTKKRLVMYVIYAAGLVAIASWLLPAHKVEGHVKKSNVVLLMDTNLLTPATQWDSAGKVQDVQLHEPILACKYLPRTSTIKTTAGIFQVLGAVSAAAGDQAELRTYVSGPNHDNAEKLSAKLNKLQKESTQRDAVEGNVVELEQPLRDEIHKHVYENDGDKALCIKSTIKSGCYELL